MSNWISVKDKLYNNEDNVHPEFFCNVLVLFYEICLHCYNPNNKGQYGIGYFSENWNLTKMLNQEKLPGEYQIEVTHWMPLPKLPETEK